MEAAGVCCDTVTYSCVLIACAETQDIVLGKRIHILTQRQLDTGNNLMQLQTALLCMYSKCGELAQAEKIFSAMSVTDGAAQNAMVAAYIQHGWLSKAVELVVSLPQCEVKLWNTIMSAHLKAVQPTVVLDLFYKLCQQSPALPPDQVSFLIVLQAAAALNSLSILQQLHMQLSKSLLTDAFIVSTLKCEQKKKRWQPTPWQLWQ